MSTINGEGYAADMLTQPFELPPLPDARNHTYPLAWPIERRDTVAYAPDEMRAYAQSCVDAALEAAAVNLETHDMLDTRQSFALAALIRSMKRSTSPETTRRAAQSRSPRT